jgi:hypothetical protein
VRLLLLSLHLAVFAAAQVNVLTWHNDNARSGQNLNEAVLTPANVNASKFGKLFTISVDGKVDAQPLYVASVAIRGSGFHNVLYVATEHNSAYAFDADTGALLWHVSLNGANEAPSDARNCSQITPEIGITSTPVIDLKSGPHGTIYMVAMTKTSSSAYHHRLHALDLSTGAEQFNGPVEIVATYPGNGAEGSGGTQKFAASQHEDRPGLLLVKGIIYTTWGSHCDSSPYTGWVIGYNESTLAQTGVINLTPNGTDGGIWMAGGGPAADTAGNIYLLMGNGTFDTTLANNFPSGGNYGNAFVKIAVAANGALSVADYFTMSNTTGESNADQDLGSGGIMLVPSLSLAIGAGKDQNIYVVDQNNLGKFNPNANNIHQMLKTGVGGPVFSSPAWFNGTLYYGAVGDVIRALPFANGSFSITPSSQTTHAFTSPGTTPSISANGTQNAILWAAENTTSAVLHAYDASNLAVELYSSAGKATFGTGNKFMVPTIVNGKVYVGTTNGVGVFGLLCSISLPLAHTSVSLLGSAGQITVTASAGCPWSATSNASWLTVTFFNATTVMYSAAPNSAPGERVGTISIADRIFSITQPGTDPRPRRK